MVECVGQLLNANIALTGMKVQAAVGQHTSMNGRSVMKDRARLEERNDSSSASRYSG